MARTMSTAAVGRVNRRFLLLALILAVISGVLAYAAFSNSGGGGSSAVEIGVVVATDVIPAGEPITAELLEVRQLPATAVGENPLTNKEDAVGRVALEQIAPGEPLLSSSLVGSSISSNDVLTYILKDGQRGIAVSVDRVINAGGLVLAGDHVDVLWVPSTNDTSYVLISDAEVTAVEQTIVDVAPAAPGLQDQTDQTEANGTTRPRGIDSDALPDAVTVTLMLSPEQARFLFCAEHFALTHDGAIRFSVRSYGDGAPLPVDAPACPPPIPLLEQQPQ